MLWTGAMLDTPALDALADRAARAHLGEENYVRSYTAPWVDSQGEEVVRVTMVIPLDAAWRIGGERAGDLLHELRQDLFNSGDDRVPTIEYTTEQDLVDEAEGRYEEGY